MSIGLHIDTKPQAAIIEQRINSIDLALLQIAI